MKDQYAPVVITGVGASTPLGNSFASIADALMEGRSGVSLYDATTFNRPQDYPAAVVRKIVSPPKEATTLTQEGFNKLGRLEQLAVSPAAWALHDARLTPAAAGGYSSDRIGVVAGIGAEQLKHWEQDYLKGSRDVFNPMATPTLVQRLAAILGITGPTTTVAAACASSGYAISLARSWLNAGWVDACVVGGCDILSPTALAAFHNLRALSRREDDPAAASRPFDADRDGFVMGEGGVFFVLERRADADRRGQPCYGQVAGVGMTSDASHMVSPCSNPIQACRAITEALEDACLTPDAVDYVNAHAAGTPVGDAAEAAAIRLAFSDAAHDVRVSSTKSMSGHLISAAAAFEALACLAAFERKCLPPTINLGSPGEGCDLYHVANKAQPAPVNVAASNSFGFGGANLCLVLKRAA